MINRSIYGTGRIIVGMLALCFLASTPASAQPRTDKVAARVQAALQQLQRYRTSRSLADLRTTVDMMGGAADIDSFSFQNHVAQRRTFVSGFVGVLKAIEQAYDPTYDPHNAANIPEIGCLPVQTTSGLRHVCNPADIKDAGLKAAYATAERANQEKIRRANYYREVAYTDSLAMAVFEVHLRQIQRLAPDSAGTDFAALDSIVRSANLTPSRQSKIEAMLYSAAGRR